MIDTGNIKSYSLAEIFDNALFRIPNYQRGYSWGASQRQEFWDDLMAIMDKTGNPRHYMSTITLEPLRDARYPSEAAGASASAYDIIDGQQRLTTILILIKELARQDVDIDRDAAARFFVRDGVSVFGYSTDRPSHDFFRTAIMGLGPYAGEQSVYTRNLQDAKDFFEAQIKRTHLPLRVLYDKIIHNLRFNIFISDGFNAFVMFETMNNRGKDLSTLELLKNRLLHIVAESDADDTAISDTAEKINNAWMTIYQYLGRGCDEYLDDDEFLKAHWIMYYRYERTNQDPHKKFLLDEHFLVRNRITLDEVTDYITSLGAAAVVWYNIHYPEDGISDAAEREWMQRLNRINSDGWLYPLIMAAYLNRDTTTAGRTELLRTLERYEFVRALRSNANNVKNHHNNTFYKMAGKLIGRDYDNRGRFEYSYISLDQCRRQISDLIDTDLSVSVDDLQMALLRPHYNSWRPGWYGFSAIAYLLYEYDVYLTGQMRQQGYTLAWPNWRGENHGKSESIEHIYPQTPKNMWPQFGGLSDTVDSPDNTCVLNSLGNLMWLLDNSRAQNIPYASKRPIYDGDTASARTVSDTYDTWTPETICRRGLEMIDFIRMRWGVSIAPEDRLKFLMLAHPYRDNTDRYQAVVDAYDAEQAAK